MVPAALALASSAAFGVADFLGGVLSRRVALVVLLLGSQTAGLTAIGLIALTQGISSRGVAVGLTAGVSTAAAIACFYAAFAVGTMSVVAPIAACGAVVPFGVGLARGEDPGALAAAGALVALAGAALASFPEHSAGGGRRKAVVLAVVSAVFFGGQYVLVAEASAAGGELSALLGTRAGSLAALVLAALVLRPAVSLPRRLYVPAILAHGLLATGAIGLFALASTRGLLSIVSILASLSPMVTILLAHLLVGERLSRGQRAGVALAIVGTALVVGS